MLRALAVIATVTLFANVAIAEEIFLRCELQNFRGNPTNLSIDLARSTATIFLGGTHPGGTLNAQITRDTLKIPFPDGDGWTINRMTGDARLSRSSGFWQGTCKLINQPALR
jgi:hypothetical protein